MGTTASPAGQEQQGNVIPPDVLQTARRVQQGIHPSVIGKMSAQALLGQIDKANPNADPAARMQVFSAMQGALAPSERPKAQELIAAGGAAGGPQRGVDLASIHPDAGRLAAAAASTVPGADTARPSQGGGFVLQDPQSGATFDTSEIFRRTDPYAMAREIKKLRPEADDESIFRAVELMGKMTQSGDKLQSMAALSLWKQIYPSATATMNNQTRRDIATGNVGGAPTVAAQGLGERQRHDQVTEGQGGQRIGQGNRRLDQGDTRIGQGQQRIDIARENQIDRKAERLLRSTDRGMAMQVRQLMDQRRTILEAARADPTHQTTPEDVAKLQQLDRQIEALDAQRATGAGAARPSAVGP
jgi:hypothetical protein